MIPSKSCNPNLREEAKVNFPIYEDSIWIDQSTVQVDLETLHAPTYSWKDMIFELFWLHKCKFNSCGRLNSRRKLFYEHVDKFNAEIDCLQVVNSIRDLQKLRLQLTEIIEQNPKAFKTIEEYKSIDSNAKMRLRFRNQSRLQLQSMRSNNFDEEVKHN